MEPAMPSKRDRRVKPTVLARLPCTAGVILAFMAWGCADKDLSRDYEFIIRVSSEPDRGLEGAGATLQGRELGLSDASGAVSINIRGHEGDVLPIEVSCPSGHRPPPSPLLVPLRHVGGDVSPEFTAMCTPLTHSIVVAVRAERGPNLPLLHLGRELTRTDSSGAAHLVLDVASDDVVELVLDTTREPNLRPKSPVLRIQPGARDEITAIHQDFTLQSQPVAKKVATRRGPKRL